jgi:hypothetical protein
VHLEIYIFVLVIPKEDTCRSCRLGLATVSIATNSIKHDLHTFGGYRERASGTRDRKYTRQVRLKLQRANTEMSHSVMRFAALSLIK